MTGATAVRPSTQPGPAYGWPRAVSGIHGIKHTAAGRLLDIARVKYQYLLGQQQRWYLDFI